LNLSLISLKVTFTFSQILKVTGWHASKKVLLIDYHLAKQGKKMYPVEGKKFFAVEKLPPSIIKKLADEFL